jgi:hypothetical protein
MVYIPYNNYKMAGAITMAKKLPPSLTIYNYGYQCLEFDYRKLVNNFFGAWPSITFIIEKFRRKNRQLVNAFIK